MPPRTRRKAATAPQETEVTTTETSTEEQTRTRRSGAKPEDAVFFAPFSTGSAPPAQTSARAYVETPYDTEMARMWKRFQDSGVPWSLAGEWTKEDKPADGWWYQRKDIWTDTIVPDVFNAESLIRRAANHLGISYRLRYLRDENKNPKLENPDDPDSGYHIWFTAAPILANRPSDEASQAADDEPEESDE